MDFITTSISNEILNFLAGKINASLRRHSRMHLEENNKASTCQGHGHHYHKFHGRGLYYAKFRYRLTSSFILAYIFENRQERHLSVLGRRDIEAWFTPYQCHCTHWFQCNTQVNLTSLPPDNFRGWIFQALLNNDSFLPWYQLKVSIKSFIYSTTSTSLLNTSWLFPKHPVAEYKLICCSIKLLSWLFCSNISKNSRPSRSCFDYFSKTNL